MKPYLNLAYVIIVRLSPIAMDIAILANEVFAQSARWLNIHEQLGISMQTPDFSRYFHYRNFCLVGTYFHQEPRLREKFRSFPAEERLQWVNAAQEGTNLMKRYLRLIVNQPTFRQAECALITGKLHYAGFIPGFSGTDEEFLSESEHRLGLK